MEIYEVLPILIKEYYPGILAVQVYDRRLVFNLNALEPLEISFERFPSTFYFWEWIRV